MNLMTKKSEKNPIRLKKPWQREIYLNPKLRGKVLALYDDQIVYVGESYREVISHKAYNREYSLFKVPGNIYSTRFLSFKIRSFKKHPWIPTVPVKFCSDNSETYTQEMLVDSGADISLINHEFGEMLGFKKGPGEVLLEAEGIGGSVQYLLRKFAVEIENLKFENVFAWLQDTHIDEMLIGRETVFDLFDIEFRQTAESVTFKQIGEE
jgi:hypothetical protein